jgi:hypothetical protein
MWHETRDVATPTWEEEGEGGGGGGVIVLSRSLRGGDAGPIQ